MIMSNSTSPKLSLYFLGAQLILVMKNERSGVLDSYLLYEKLNELLESPISFTHYMYTLNWLHLINAISLTENGDIEKCF